MPKNLLLGVEGTHPLPPLILHPFTESSSSVQVLESARATISMLRQGGDGGERAVELELRLLEGRYAELRMLFFVGKDVFRWIDQCIDTCQRSPALHAAGIAEQSFGHLLIKQTPADVAQKLTNWGVIEHTRIFSRAVGIYCQFSEPPSRDRLQPDYLRHYFRYADYSFSCWKEMVKYPVLPEEQFPFTLYASGEYTKLLEEQWKDA
jgi:hypothetical protein